MSAGVKWSPPSMDVGDTTSTVIASLALAAKGKEVDKGRDGIRETIGLLASHLHRTNHNSIPLFRATTNLF